MRITKPIRRRAAALRAESRSLRAESALIRGRTELLTNMLISTMLAGDGHRRGDADVKFSLHAGRMLAAVGLARGRLRNWLERSGFDPEEVADILLACSEACANAVEHPVHPRRYAFEVEAQRTPEEIELAVRDFGGWRDTQADPNRGRGLEMIRQLMDATEIVTDDGTKIVMRRRRRPA